MLYAGKLYGIGLDAHQYQENSAAPGVVIGKKGQDIEVLKNELQKMTATERTLKRLTMHGKFSKRFPNGNKVPQK